MSDLHKRDMKKKTKNSKTREVTVYLSDREYAYVDEVSQQQGISKAHFFRDLLRKLLKRGIPKQ